MSEVAERAFPSIFHPTDFSASSNQAFEHALKIAVANRSRFSISHVDTKEGDGPEWTDFPHIRSTLERWSLLPKGSPRQAVGDELGVHVKKVERISKNPVESIAGFLETERADLIVLSTAGREGLPRWLRPSFSEALVRRSLVATLFVPAGAKAFVSHDKGEVMLDSILIPTDRKPYPGIGIDIAGGLLKSLKVQSPGIEALYVGDQRDMPAVNPPRDLDCSFEQSARPGNPVDEILRRADETDANLIVMVTEGRHGFLDALRGSTTEQIVRRASCPVLTVPAAG
ncbi:MAG: universal stress protein [Alphaproteobacteria bacterium]|nr:universal stress protein [Alphaproteobacteria bacterium]